MVNKDVTVVFVDIDGTLVGDVSPQVCEWEVLRELHPKGIPAFKKSLVQHLKAGLLRPGVADCLDVIRQRYAPAEFYLYTAAEATWAACIVGCMEQVTSIKFNRPIFARKECVQEGGRFTKSPSKLLPKVLLRLHAHYPHLNLRTLQDNYIMIDNTTITARDRSRLIFCPTYNHTDWYDCLRSVPEEQLAAGFTRIVPLLEQYGALPRSVLKRMSQNKLKYDEFKIGFFTQLAHLIAKRNDRRRDDFWRFLGQLLSASSNTTIETKLITSANHALQRRYKYKD